MSNNGYVARLAARRVRNPARRLRLAGQAQRQRFICGEVAGHQLRQPDRMELAAGESGHQRFAGAGEDREPCQQRIVGRRMRAVRKRVDKQIGGSVPRQMLLLRHFGREDQTRRIDAGRRGFPLQVGGRLGLACEQPQNACRHRIQQAHPDREHRRQYLGRFVEAAEHEAPFGQTAFGARWRWPQRRASRIAGIRRVRHMPEAFGIDDASILAVQSDPEPWIERSVEHPLTVHLQDLRAREPTQQRLAHLGGVHAGALRQQQGLGDGFDRGRHHQLVAGLADLSGAARVRRARCSCPAPRTPAWRGRTHRRSRRP